MRASAATSTSTVSMSAVALTTRDTLTPCPKSMSAGAMLAGRFAP